MNASQPPFPAADSDALLQVRHLAKAFGGVQAVADVSFDLPAGQLLALIGPNGAGKSTCFNLINGQLKPDAGSIRLGGEPLAGRRARDIWRLGVGRTFQVPATFGTLSVLDNVRMALLSRERKLFGLWRRATSQQSEEAFALLTRVGMQAQANRPCGVLAYGDVKRLELALALAGRPRLLLMDEPTAGMAPDERHALMDLTRALVAEQGLAVLFTEHSLDVVFAHADRIAVLAQGRLIANDTPEAIRNHPQVRAIYLGSAAAEHAPTSPEPHP